ncbi:MAG: WG repeat-containing protein [Zoogloeaceae bacterium]|jgi:predicted DNA-binding WGR domain protein|nr:WG repeat-containing protein [Zoogloeaceae bacterium]
MRRLLWRGYEVGAALPKPRLWITLAAAWLFVGGLCAHAQTNPEDVSGIDLEGKYGYINGKGELVIPLLFDYAWSFADNGLALVKEKNKWGFINAQGQFVIPPRFDTSGYFANNALAPVREKEKWGYIDRQGQFVIPPRFEHASLFANNGLAIVQENGQQKYIDQNGETVLFVDVVCGRKALRNARDEILWPPQSADEICAGQGDPLKNEKKSSSRLPDASF